MCLRLAVMLSLKNCFCVSSCEGADERVEGHVKDLKISEVNAAMGYLTRVILLLSKYFMVGTVKWCLNDNELK